VHQSRVDAENVESNAAAGYGRLMVEWFLPRRSHPPEARCDSPSEAVVAHEEAVEFARNPLGSTVREPGAR
jgi:hypothetical protein